MGKFNVAMEKMNTVYIVLFNNYAFEIVGGQELKVDNWEVDAVFSTKPKAEIYVKTSVAWNKSYENKDFSILPMQVDLQDCVVENVNKKQPTIVHE